MNYYVPDDTFVDQDRIYRRPIGEWAADLAEEFTATSGSLTAAEVKDCTVLLNNAALIYVYAGRSDVAQYICEHECHWHCRLSEKHNDSEIAALALQPVINLGRLARQKREYRLALELFADTYRATNGHVNLLGNRMTQTSFMRRVAEPMYVYETGKTLLLAGELETALQFIDSLHHTSVSNGTMVMATELATQVCLRDNEISRAITLLNDVVWNTTYLSVVAKLLYRAIIYAAAGHEEKAAAVIAHLVPNLDKILGRSREGPDHALFRVAFVASELCLFMGKCELAEALALMAWKSEWLHNDVPLSANIAHIGRKCGRDELPRAGDVIRHGGYKALAKRFNCYFSLNAQEREALENLESEVTRILALAG